MSHAERRVYLQARELLIREVSVVRGLEHHEAEAWVEAQNRVTFAHLESIPYRAALTARLEALFNYPKFTAPIRRGTKYFFAKNDGLQNQSVW